MENLLAEHPEVLEHLDKSERYQNSAHMEHGRDGRSYLVVTQNGTSMDGGGQVLFRLEGGKASYVAADNVVRLPTGEHLAELRRPEIAVARSAADHAAVAAESIRQVGVFRSNTGPDNGNLACLWSVRHIVHLALGEWITLSDGTSDFGDQLEASFGNGMAADHVLPGGIIISPTGSGTGTARHGHVGILGGGTGGARLIYSNNSAAAVWAQNYTVSSWIAHYQSDKGLAVRFYPLPSTSL